MALETRRIGPGLHTQHEMLTPTDTHYVAGLLTLSSSPAGVEVEVGSMVPDTAAGVARDVDVTIKGKDGEGRTVILAGREVKAHGRPLDSTHVEQLACKLNDMPGLGSRAIVSASGYTTPAVRKAAKHGILLYELVELPDTGTAFDHFRANRVPLTQSGLEWFGPLQAHVNPRHHTSTTETAACAANPPMRFRDGRCYPDCPDLNAFIKLMKLHVANELMKQWGPDEQIPGRWKVAHVVLDVSAHQAEVVTRNVHLPITEIVFDGKVRWRVETRESRFMVLRRLGEAKPDAGCCVFELPGWGLCGLVVSNTNREIRFMNIPVSDRKKKKVYRQVLRHIVPPGAAPFLPAADTSAVLGRLKSERLPHRARSV